MSWSPEQYEKYKAERAAPLYDLFAQVVKRPHMQVVDLGCGTGEYTRMLFDLLDRATVRGIDSSSQMLAKSSSFCCAGCSTHLGDLQELEGDYDLIFSNAALHWCANHRTLIPRLWSHLRPGGQLLIQMPRNHAHPSHRLALLTARELFPELVPSPAAKQSTSVPDTLQQSTLQPTDVSQGKRQVQFESSSAHDDVVSSVLHLEEYAQLFFNLGDRSPWCIEKIYSHVLANADAVMEWTKGTLLVPIMERLNEEQCEVFLHSYRERLRSAMPGSPVLYTFKRVLLSARKAE